MHLVIDLRFYRPEPYGLAVHIRDLFTELIPLLLAQTTFTKITLVLDSKISDLNLLEVLPWWNLVQNNSKFNIFFSKCSYYTFTEQTLFLKEINNLKPDLTYFFTFNFPILFNKPFVYQVLDLSIPKTRSHFNLKVQAMLLCFRQGVKKAKHIFFLAKNTQSDASLFTDLNFTDSASKKYKPNTVIYNGLNPLYLKQDQANSAKSEIISGNYSKQKEDELNNLKLKLGINKPYFLFISIWRKYKNVELLVEAFESFQNQNNSNFQLVLAGKPDSKSPEILQNIHNNEEFKKGNIIIPGYLLDEEVIMLQDGAKAFIAPSLSEGFGLWMAEAASRGTPVLCSDIPVFHEILDDNSALFFDPYDKQNLIKCLQNFSDLQSFEVARLTKNAYESSQDFRWNKIAQKINQTLLEIAGTL